MTAPISNTYLCGCHHALECPGLVNLRLARTLRRLRNASMRPYGVTPEEEQAVIEAGLMSRLSLPFGAAHYMVTDAGHEFLREN